MFIRLHSYYVGELTVNVNYISRYCESIVVGKNTIVYFSSGEWEYVKELPEEIDTLIEESLEQRVTNIDNLLGISCLNYQYSRI